MATRTVYDTTAHDTITPTLLGTGTAIETKFLRGDGVWADPPGVSGTSVASVNGLTGSVILRAEDLGALPTSAAASFATSAQGARADSAVQPGSLAAVATSARYTDLVRVPVVNLGRYAVGDGVADDAAAIQQAIDELTANQIGLLPPPHAGGTKWVVGSTLLLDANRRYDFGGSLIQAKAAASLPAVVATRNWQTNATTFAAGVQVSNLNVDGNKAATGVAASGGAGLILLATGPILSSITVANADLGVRLANQNRAGTTLSGTAPGANLQGLWLTGCGVGLVLDYNGVDTFSDGILRDCTVLSSARDAISMGSSQGWRISQVRIVSAGLNGIVLNGCQATQVTQMLILGFGAATAANGYAYGVNARRIGDRGLSLSQVDVTCVEVGSVNYRYFRLEASTTAAFVTLGSVSARHESGSGTSSRWLVTVPGDAARTITVEVANATVRGFSDTTPLAATPGTSAFTLLGAPLVVDGASPTGLKQNFSTGTSTDSTTLRIFYASGAYPALPTTKPVGLMLVEFYGPSAPTWSALPSWVGVGSGLVPATYAYLPAA